MVLLVWLLLIFIFYKFITELFYYDGINIFTCFVASIAYVAIIFLSSGFYAERFGRHLVHIKFAGQGPYKYLFSSLPVFVVALFASYIAIRIVVFAFDDGFREEVELLNQSRWNRNFFNDGGVGFMFLATIPITLHWVTALAPAFLEARIHSTLRAEGRDK